MQVLTDIEPTRRLIRELQARGQQTGLVPTMGALHEGHLSLMRTARQQCDFVAVTIFVNPTQFGPSEDFDAYPRTLGDDLAACDSMGVGLVFTPTLDGMYAPDAKTTVAVAGLTGDLCGRHRPGHFDGVTTVVAKLFNILPCDRAFFGEKDYQQLTVIRRMARDLDLPIDVVGCPTIREADGLAMSSRNAYLSADQRRQAASLNRALRSAVDRAAGGERSAATLTDRIREEILAAGPADIDYIEAVDAQTLQPLRSIDRVARICLAVRIGACRLIDNIGVDVPPSAG